MTASLDVDAYLGRIEWTGTAGPTFHTLAAVVGAHMSKIPFENLDVLLGRQIRLDIDGLQRKLVHQRRGGYCFEHVTLFAAVLEAIGFKPARHSARVTLITHRAASPRTHMFLTVPLAEGTFVVDPGFGALAPRIPVPLVDSERVTIDGETHWMARAGDDWILRTNTGGNIADCWVSTLERDNPVDFEVGNHYTSTHRASPFVNRLMLRALTPAGRVTVMNRDVTVWQGNAAQSMQLADRAALRSLLIKHFGFDLPEIDTLRVPSIPEWT